MGWGPWPPRWSGTCPAERSSHQQHGGAGDAAGAEIRKRAISLTQRVFRRGHLDVMLGCEVKEGPRVGAGVRRHRAQLALLEKVTLVVEHRNVAQVDSGDRQRAAAVQRLQR